MASIRFFIFQGGGGESSAGIVVFFIPNKNNTLWELQAFSLHSFVWKWCLNIFVTLSSETRCVILSIIYFPPWFCPPPFLYRPVSIAHVAFNGSSCHVKTKKEFCTILSCTLFFLVTFKHMWWDLMKVRSVCMGSKPNTCTCQNLILDMGVNPGKLGQNC